MGLLQCILQVFCFADKTRIYRRLPDDNAEQDTNETQNAVNETSQPQRQIHHSTIDNIDQSYSLIWLDEHSDKLSFDTQYIKTILCKFNPQCFAFYTKLNEFLYDINYGKHKNDNILLITSGSLFEKIINESRIKVRLPIVIIFCANSNKYIQLQTYENVVGICTDYETLKNLIQRELTSLRLCLNEKIPIKSLKFLMSTIKCNCKDDRNNNIIINEKSFYYILIVDILKQMPKTDQSRDTWLNKCREYYRGNIKELKIIDQFNTKYRVDEAIQWYQQDSFVYRLVNRAIQSEDITLWYLSRYIIADICEQIEFAYRQQNYSEILKLYRGQLMSIQEIESIKELTKSNGLFCTPVFLSTTKNISVAEFYGDVLGDSNNTGIVSVLFEIIVDSANLKTIRFVDVNQYLSNQSIFSSEEEFLFIIGSVFRITNIEQLGTKLYKIYMEATDDGADIIQDRLNKIRNKYKTMDINLRFGQYLLDMNQLAKAESYFLMLLQEIVRSNNQQRYENDLIFINNSLGELHLRTTNYNEAFRYFKNAYSIRLNNRIPKNIFASYISFGHYYKAIGDSLQARQWYMDALDQLKENAEINQININRVNMNIASIHAIDREYYKSLQSCFKVQNSLEKIKSIYPIYYDMIICQGLIGDIYFHKTKYNEAEEAYLNVFNMCKQYLCIGDRQFIHCIHSLTELYRQKNNDNNQYALKFIEDQLELHQQHFSQDHLSIAHLLMKIGDIKQDIDYYERALEILYHNDHLEYLTIAQCYRFLGDYYLNNIQINDNIKKALENYYKIREIYIKIYPKNHQRIIEIQDLIHFNEQQQPIFNKLA